MTTDDERREAAERLRDVARADGGPLGDIGFTEAMHRALGGRDWRDMTKRLADLIEPAPTSSDRGPTSDPTERGIDSIHDWCRERLEGADGAEDFLYCSIMSAIEEYRHPERVTARTARPVGRDALLALADEMDRDGRMQRERQKVGERWFIDGLDVREYARRIREACGEEDS